MAAGSILASEALRLEDLITPTDHGIASRILAKNSGGSVTLFAFADGEGLSEHTAPFDALVLVLDGALALTIGGQPVEAGPGTIRAHAGRDPHAVDATAASRMLLIMLKEAPAH
jgi:quercetin dioxygenase-like cupin family protein